MKGILLFLVFFPALLQAQLLVKHNLYPFNADFANPAVTGFTTCLEINATDMHQWVGISNSPNVQSFALQKGLVFDNGQKKNGVGLNLIRDSNGPTKIINGELLYSFHALVGKRSNTWLSMGLSAEILQGSIDEGNFTPVFDPEINGNIERETRYNASAGVYLYNDVNYAGIAIYNLLPVSGNFALGYGGDRFFVSLQAGHLFLPSRNMSLETSFQAFAGREEFQIDLSNRMKFINNLWAGVTFRKYLGRFDVAGQNMLLFLGYNYLNWRFCYNYNFDINRTQYRHYGTHLLSVGYRICQKNIACPAYR